MKFSDLVLQQLAQRGVDTIFYLPGGGCMHLVDSLGRSESIQPVVLLHEQSVAVAAESFAQIRGSFGVGLVTTGPGGTNAVTGVAAAYVDSTPLVIFSGQVKTADLSTTTRQRQRGFQEIDICSIVAPITKASEQVLDPSDGRNQIEHALDIAISPRRGPVWIDIPLDIQSTDVDWPIPTMSMNGENRILMAPRIGEEVIERIRGAFAESKFPALLLGNGARADGAYRDFIRWAEEQNVQVLTTWKAADLIDDSHPNYAGRPGAIATHHANLTIQHCDVLLSVGARLDLGQTAYNPENFAKRAQRFIIDIDPRELDQHERALKILATAEQFAKEVLPEISCPEVTPLWRDEIEQWKRKWPLTTSKDEALEDGLSIYSFISLLSDFAKADDLIIPGSSGACSEIVLQGWKVKAGQRIVNSQGLGPMGFGIPAAIGGCLAGDLRRTICVDGDGGFAMNLQELQSVKRLNLPVWFFVLDNNGYGSIRDSQNRYFGGHLVGADGSSGLELPDYEKVIPSFGIPIRRVSTERELKHALSYSESIDGPIAFIVKLSASISPRGRVSSSVQEDGRIRTDDLDQISPRLLPEDLEEIWRRLYDK